MYQQILVIQIPAVVSSGVNADSAYVRAVEFKLSIYFIRNSFVGLWAGIQFAAELVPEMSGIVLWPHHRKTIWLLPIFPIWNDPMYQSTI